MRTNWNKQNPATDWQKPRVRLDFSTGRRKSIPQEPWALSCFLYGAPEPIYVSRDLPEDERIQREVKALQVVDERENYRMKIFHDGPGKWRLVCPVDLPGGSVNSDVHGVQAVYKTKAGAENAGMLYASRRIRAQVWLIKKLAHPEAIANITPNLNRFDAAVSLRGSDDSALGENCYLNLGFKASSQGVEFYLDGYRNSSERLRQQKWAMSFNLRNNKFDAMELSRFAEKLRELADAVEKNLVAGTLKTQE